MPVRDCSNRSRSQDVKRVTTLRLGFVVTFGVFATAGVGVGSDSSQVTRFAYFGEAPPDTVAKEFAPQFILEGTHSAPTFSPDGREVYWSRYYSPESGGGRTQHIFFSRLVDTQWTKPAVAVFSGTYSDGGPCFSSDGSRLFFGSNRPLVAGGEAFDEYIYDIWYVDRTADGWGEPVHLDFNSDRHETMPSVAADGSLYFMSNRAGCRGIYDIFVAEPTVTGFSSPANIGAPITSADMEVSPCIAPDESFIVFAYQRRASGNGLHVSFRDEDGSWSSPVRLSDDINSHSVQRFPGLSPDGKYLFFSKEGRGKRNIYWVDSKILRRYRP
jgi:Tol biopolymer transport system component